MCPATIGDREWDIHVFTGGDKALRSKLASCRALDRWHQQNELIAFISDAYKK